MHGQNAERRNMMDAVYSDKLRERRREIELTLRHLERERREVDQNTEWVDETAYQNRVTLLNRLTTWYREEIGQIERALGRVKESRYGLCLACHEPIDAERLDSFPDTELCSDCEEFRERSHI
jgi:RNA polymerase-binding transcription factor DksA